MKGKYAPQQVKIAGAKMPGLCRICPQRAMLQVVIAIRDFTAGRGGQRVM
jgi:hypothetical protein